MIGLDTLASLFRELAALLDMGMSLPEAGGKMQSVSHGDVKRLVTALRDQVLAGSTLRQALQHESDSLPPMVSAALGARDAEMTPSELLQLAGLLDETERRITQIASGLLYPRLITLVCIIAVWLFSWVASLLLATTLAAYPTGQWSMPLLLKVMGGFNRVVPIVLTVVGLLFWYGLRTDGWRQKLPLIGSWLRRHDIVSWLSWMDFLLPSGMDAATAMKTAATSCLSPRLRVAFCKAADRVASGDRVAAALEHELPLPGSVGWMLALAERLEFKNGSLLRVAAAESRELALVAERGIVFIEPLAIIALGVVVGTFLASVLLPLYNLIGQLY